MNPHNVTRRPGTARPTEALAPALGILLATLSAPGQQRSGDWFGKTSGDAVERQHGLTEKSARGASDGQVRVNER